MRCSHCKHIIRLSRYEKNEIKKYGSTERKCSFCGTLQVFDSAWLPEQHRAIVRNKRREQGLCTDCGKRKATEGYMSCERCRTLRAGYRNDRRSIWNEMEEPEKPIKKGMTIEEINAEALKHGMTYGQYVALKGL